MITPADDFESLTRMDDIGIDQSVGRGDDLRSRARLVGDPAQCIARYNDICTGLNPLGTGHDRSRLPCGNRRLFRRYIESGRIGVQLRLDRRRSIVIVAHRYAGSGSQGRYQDRNMTHR